MTSVATVERKHPVVELMESDAGRKYIEDFLPKDVDLKRVIASVLLAIANDKKRQLGKCTSQSLVLGVARIQQWGLELGTTAHLLPFSNKIMVWDETAGREVEKKVMEATPVADYKGLCELMVASGAVRHVETHVVYQGDQFEYRLGLEPKIDHLPANPRAKGAPITFAYCILHLPFSRFAFDVMNAADIDEIRQKYSKQWKDGPLPAWYAKKTVVRQVAKLVPKNPRLAKILAVMEQEREVEFDVIPDAKKIEALRDEDEIVLPVDESEPGDEEGEGFTPPF